MRYPKEHKEKTRRAIIAAAARLFRQRGYAGVGIDEIMAKANLTRGGFYGYFRSKADLFAAVMGAEHDFNRRMAERSGQTVEELGESALAVVAGYLDPRNRASVGRGCAMASLSVDVARADKQTRDVYTDKIKTLAAEFARGLESGKGAIDERAMASIALSVGGLMIARAMSDTDYADRFTAACRAEVTRILGQG